MADELKRVKTVARSLKENREDWEGHYEQLEQHFLPRRGNFSSDPVSKGRSNRGDYLNRKVLDSTPMKALRILQSGLQAGITSPSRPWFRLQPLRAELREHAQVKNYLHRATVEMRRLMERSGLYNMLHVGYRDLGVYGTECAIIENKNELDLRGTQLMPGSYWLGMSGEQRVDTMYREFDLTVEQVVGKYVFKGRRYGDPQWDVVPHHIKKNYDDGNVTKPVAVSHLITPRRDRDMGSLLPSNMPIASIHWLKDDDRAENMQRVLLSSGYRRNPISASRWDVQGYDVYGRSPGMEALPDVRELYFKRRDMAEMIRRLNRPPMNAHTSLRNSRFSFLPGAVNFMEDPEANLRPTMAFNPDLSALANDIEQTKESVWSAMYADLFMMISQLDRRQITATEIDERREEKLIALGPVLERMHFEKLLPLVETLYERVVESGVLGDPPSVLDGEELEIDFISMLAQAQKAVATGSMERFAAYVGNLSAVSAEVIDKFDVDQSVDEYADMVGVPPSVVRSDEAVNEMRAQRRQAEQQQAALAAAEQGAKAAASGAQAAKVLSEADQPRGAQPGDILRRVGVG